MVANGTGAWINNNIKMKKKTQKLFEGLLFLAMGHLIQWAVPGPHSHHEIGHKSDWTKKTACKESKFLSLFLVWDHYMSKQQFLLTTK